MNVCERKRKKGRRRERESEVKMRVIETMRKHTNRNVGQSKQGKTGRIECRYDMM